MKWLTGVGTGLLVVVVGSAIYVAVNNPGATRIQSPAAPDVNPAPLKRAIDDSGSIIVHYSESSNAEHQAFRRSLEEWGVFGELAEELDAAFLVPRDLQIAFTDCGVANAAYDPSQAAILICYELINQLVSDYRPYAESDSALAASVWQTTFFVFYHEVGHALIDLLDLPITGREEDAVDQLATMILLEAGEYGRETALSGAQWFAYIATRTEEEIPFWDEHGLGQQRYFNILCWIYGSDTTAHADLIGSDWGLPPQRAERCPSEYQRMSRAWETMLADFIQ